MNARTLIDQVVEGQDDLSKLPIPASGKKYARLKGKAGTDPSKFKVYTKMIADLVNHGSEEFKNRQTAANPTLVKKS